MISLDLWRSRIGGWRGHAKSQFLHPTFRKSNLSMFICLLWRITTCLSAITISVLLIIGGVEINPGSGSTSDEEISPMEIDCVDDVFESSQTLQHTPISSQVLPMTGLDLSSQCSSDVSMTPEKSFSTPKSRKRKGYRARKDRKRVNIKKRRIDDEDFRIVENEIRLKRFNDNYEDPDFQSKHKENQLRNSRTLLKDPEKRTVHNVQRLQAMTERLKDPEKRAKHNTQQLQAMTERLKDPEKRAKHNKRKSDKLKDPSIRDKHNSYVLKKYITDRASVEPTSLDYFFQISQGPTFICSCCGCLHFRRSVVILTRTRLDSMSEYSPTFINQVCSHILYPSVIV